jgi:hypothetical protein
MVGGSCTKMLSWGLLDIPQILGKECKATILTIFGERWRLNIIYNQ